MLHFLHSLDPPEALRRRESETQPDPRTALRQTSSSASVPRSIKDGSEAVSIIIGGYSYGAIIASHVPHIESIIERFASSAKGTAESEIRLRAAHMASESNREWRPQEDSTRGRSPKKPKAQPTGVTPCTVVGGEESPSDNRRRSREHRMSVEMIRQSIDASKRKISHRYRNSQETLGSMPEEPQVDSVKVRELSYLLISPPLPPISPFLMGFSKLGFVSKGMFCNGDADAKLIKHPAIVVHGGNDIFTSAKKYREWCAGLEAGNASFRRVEVEGAGHFWREKGVLKKAKAAVKDWARARAESGTLAS